MSEPRNPAEPLRFEILDSNLSLLMGRIDQLNRTARRLHLPEIQKKFIETKTETHSRNGESVLIRIHIYDFLGESPRLPGGWEFFGTIEHVKEGINLLRSVPGKEIPETFRTNKPLCDHCKTRRYRKDTYIVRNEAGEFKQIGKNCVRHFMGHRTLQSLEYLGMMIELLSDLDQEVGDGEFSGGHGTRYYMLTDVLNLAAEFTRTRGFMSRKTAMESDGRLDSTSGLVSEQLNPPKRDSDSWRSKKFEPITPSEDSKELARKALVWVSEQKNTSVGYIMNLYVLSQLTEITDKHLGLACSMVFAYQKEMGQIELREKKKREIVSTYQGTIGKREVFTLILKKVIALESDFSDFYSMYIFEDSNGNVFVWRSGSAPDMNEGFVMKIKATVKQHKIYKDIPQTMINRCVVMETIAPVPAVVQPEENAPHE